MEVAEINRVPKSLNPYVKLYKMTIEVHETLEDELQKTDAVELENQSNRLIEDTQTLQVVLKRIKIYECEECYYCYTTERDYRLHLLKHATPIVKNEFSYEKYGNYVKKFKCENCDMRFVAASTLKAHSVVHLPYPHICHCGIGYNKREDLMAHKQLVHPEFVEEEVWQPKTSYTGKKVRSEFCIKSEYVPPQSNAIKTNVGVYKPKQPKNLKNKRKKKSEQKKRKFTGIKIPDVACDKVEIDGQTKYLCLTCNKVYSSYTSIKFHNLTHTGEKLFKCDMCDKSFSQRNNLNIHKLGHAGIKFECRVCGKQLARKLSLRLHMRVHTGERPHECDYCGKDFADPSAFARHIRTHTGDKRYQCPYCPMRFSDASGLIVHKRRHVGIKDYKCEICEKEFYSIADLNNHISRIHVRLLNYECDYCGKRFSTKEYLKSHILRTGVHSGIKCYLCPRVFYNKIDFKSHLKIHRKLEFDDYECDYCGETFEGKESIAKHLEMEHTFNFFNFNLQ